MTRIFVDDSGAPEVEPVDESRGLRGRLSSLIGRDLGERHDAEARHEPPLAERAGAAHRAGRSRDPCRDRAAIADDGAAPFRRCRSRWRQSLARGLARDDVRKLHAVLHELAECRKLIEAAVARAD